MSNNVLPKENLLLPGVSSLQSSDRALAEGLNQELDTGTVNSLWSKYTTLGADTMELMNELESLDTDAADTKYEINQFTMRGVDIAPGIEDSFKSVTSDFDRAGGQLNAASKVLNAGAGKHKVAEYLQNAIDHVGAAEDDILYFEGVVSDVQREVGVETTINCTSLLKETRQFRQQLEGAVRSLGV